MPKKDAPQSAVDRVMGQVGAAGGAGASREKTVGGVRPIVFTLVQEGSDDQLTEEFSQRSILVGRGDSANLRVNDPKASKIHCVIDITSEDEVYILDLGSTNGTKVNGEKIHRQRIQPGDEIRVGRTTMQFEFRTLTQEEESSVVEFAESFEGYFTQQEAEPGEADLKGRERRKVIEVVEIWGESIIGVEHFMRPDKITIGEGDDCNFFTPTDYLPSDPFNIVVNEGKEYYLCFSEMMAGEIELREKVSSLQELIANGAAQKVHGDLGTYYRYRIDPEAKCRVDIGSLTFFLQRVRPAKRVASQFFSRQDWAYLGILFFVLLLLGGGGAGAVLMGLIDFGPSDDFGRDQDRFVRMVLVPEAPPTPPPKQRQKGAKGNKDAGEGARAKKEEGKRGKKDSKVENTRGGPVKAAQDRRIAESAGVLGALGQNDLNAVFGTGAMGGGMDEHLGGLIGTTGADQRGSGGLGLRGTGRGGGGTALGIGGLGTKGRGTGASGHGKGGGYFGKGKGDASIGIGGEETLVVGYDKRIIDAVIKRHLAQIQYCYEKELRRNPKLYGKIIVNFKFGKDGKVMTASIKSSTLKGTGKAEAEACIVQRFKGLRFPPPKGGVVIVNYPLLFKSTG